MIKEDEVKATELAQATSNISSSTKNKLIKNTLSGGSSYTPIQFEELQRLRIQATLYAESDIGSFKKALNLIEKKDDLVGLDVGCAEGLLTTKYFGAFDMFTHVLGVDKSEEAIEQTKANEYSGSYGFKVADLETKDGIAVLKSWLVENNLSGFDVIFSAYVFHHLHKPVKLLRELRKLLNPNGVIVIRSVDDRLSASFPDEQNIVNEIFDLSDRMPGMSKRDHGRQLYTQLWKTGFRNIDISYTMLDTVGKNIDERLVLFQDNFSWRPNSLKNAISAYPQDKEKLEADLEWLENALEELESMFESEDYYHLEPVITIIGQKIN